MNPEQAREVLATVGWGKTLHHTRGLDPVVRANVKTALRCLQQVAVELELAAEQDRAGQLRAEVLAAAAPLPKRPRGPKDVATRKRGRK